MAQELCHELSRGTGAACPRPQSRTWLWHLSPMSIDGHYFSFVCTHGASVMSRICSYYIFSSLFKIFFFKQTYQHSASLFQTVQHMPFFSYARELMSTLCHLLEFISSPPRCQCLCRVGRRHNTSSISLSQLTSTFQHSLLNTTTRIEIHSPSRWRVSVHYRQKTKRKIKKSFSSFQASLPFLGRRCHTNAVTQYLHATNITKDLYLLVNRFIHERSGESPVYGLYLTSSNPQMCSFASVSVCIYACILIIYLYMW